MTKKLFVTAALFIGMIAGAMVFSSFRAQKQAVELEIITTEINVPVYWEGTARASDGWDYVRIKVYQTEGMCNSFYAVIQDGYSASVKKGDEVYVRNNPNYDPDRGGSRFTSKYMITYQGKDFFFNM